MRVLHGVQDVAGQAGLSAFGLREVGVEARAWFEPHPFGYGLRPDFRPRARGRAARVAERALRLPFLLRRFDTFHFHAASSFLPGQRDLPLLRRLGKRACVEFWGSEARLPRVEAARNPFYVNAYQEDDAANARRLERWSELTGGVAVMSDHSLHAHLLPFFPVIHVVGQRVDTRALAPAFPAPDARRPVLVHAPSQLEAKGTRFVRLAVERLRGKGLDFEYLEVHGCAQEEAVRAYRRADLVVDQLCMGSHGVFAAEAMALGKPVVCWILPELGPTYPRGFPLINANPETVEAVLEEWLQCPERRHARGVQSREYAERVHDCREVARRLLRAYAQI